MTQVLVSTVYMHNCQALADRYCELTGMTTWVVWNTTQHRNDMRLCLMDQGQLNALRFQGEVYKTIYCSDQQGRWLVDPKEIDPHLDYGRVRELNPEIRRLSELYHELWTRDVGTDGYDKEKWQELGKLINHFGGKV
jgi:hypothetical protein